MEQLTEPALPPYRIIGESFTEYIIVECERELIFIDKHAAHERMLFDRLKSRSYETMSQALLVPVVADIGREEKELLLDNGALLEELGFEIEDFGGTSVSVRRLPADVDMADAEALLEELCRDIRDGAKQGNGRVQGGDKGGQGLRPHRVEARGGGRAFRRGQILPARKTGNDAPRKEPAGQKFQEDISRTDLSNAVE